MLRIFRVNFEKQKEHFIEMAGVESMIVEEKQAPTKQIDREKVIVYPFSTLLSIFSFIH